MRTHHTHFSLPLSASHYPQPCHHRAAMPSRHPTTAIRAHRPHSQPIHRTAFLAAGHLSVSWRPFREAAGLRLSFTRSSPTCLKGKGHPVPGLHGEHLGPGILPCLLAPHSLQAGPVHRKTCSGLAVSKAGLLKGVPEGQVNAHTAGAVGVARACTKTVCVAALCGGDCRVLGQGWVGWGVCCVCPCIVNSVWAAFGHSGSDCESHVDCVLVTCAL